MLNTMHSRIFITALLLAVLFSSCQEPIKQKHVVAFYNLENLFDTIDSPDTNDEEFTPESFKKWNTERYLSKLNNMSTVISEIGKDQDLQGPSVIGLSEVENKKVIEDLIHNPKLQGHNYQIIHTDSPDKRGIDVAFIYNPKQFKVLHHHFYPLIIHDVDSGNRIFTRDQLLVSGLLNNDTLHIIVNHWPSRYGGQERSIPLRKEAALLNRHIIDSLLNINPLAKVITMGDFNDDPTDPSISNFLKAHDTKENLAVGELHNPLAQEFNKGKGSLFYHGKWNLFDQMIVTQGLANSEDGLIIDTAIIFNKPWLIQQDGDYKGNLLRTFGGRTYLNGYSDHLPVYMILE
jgi:endonuclease/exonuclease/phosphatase family metal-dependent hydrolase